MRKAMVAKLSLTAAVGLGTLFHAGTAQAETPPKQLDQTGDIKWAPAPPTTIGPIVANPVDPDPDPPFDPDLPIAQPEADDCDQPSCDKAPVPQPEPECNPIALCDEITSDPGCTWTHGCPEDPEPECNELLANCDEITSDPGCNVTHGDCDEDGGDEGTDGGDEGTDDGGDESTTGGSTDGEPTDGGSGGSLPRTGAEMATWAVAGLGLTGIGAALRKLGKRAA
jgi:hypothetical protein